jgi:hypothetical protein
VVARTRENGKGCGLNRKHACQGGHVSSYSRRISVIEWVDKANMGIECLEIFWPHSRCDPIWSWAIHRSYWFWEGCERFLLLLSDIPQLRSSSYDVLFYGSVTDKIHSVRLLSMIQLLFNEWNILLLPIATNSWIVLNSVRGQCHCWIPVPPSMATWPIALFLTILVSIWTFVMQKVL